MTLGASHHLWLLSLIPALVIAYAFDGQRRRRVIERLGHLPTVARMIASASPARRRWLAVLRVAVVGLLALALLRPQVPGRARLTETRGLDLVVALDFSRSMLARDVYPSRLDRAKAELDRLIDRLRGDRLGLVAFAGETMSYPLTVDYEAAKLFWRDLGPDDMPVGGTDLGRAIRAGLELLQRGKKASDRRKGAQIILLLTDGEDTEGQGMAAAKEAAAAGVRIYTIGIGTGDRPFVQLYDDKGAASGFLTGENGEPVRVGLDEGMLRQMATATGGEYFALDVRHSGVERVQAAIAGLERTQEEARFEREPDDVGRWALLPAFLLLLIETTANERRRRRARPATPAATTGISRALPLVLLAVWPMLSGFDLFLRRDPNLEAGNRALADGKAEDALSAYDRAAVELPDEPIVRFDRVDRADTRWAAFLEAQKRISGRRRRPRRQPQSRRLLQHGQLAPQAGALERGARRLQAHVGAAPRRSSRQVEPRDGAAPAAAAEAAATEAAKAGPATRQKRQEGPKRSVCGRKTKTLNRAVN